MTGLFDRAKWGLFLRIIPFTVLFGCAKVSMHYLGWEPWSFDALTGALLSAATFVIAFVLSGTLKDYNESEDIPVQLVNGIASIQDVNRLTAIAHPDYHPQPLTEALIQVLAATTDWLTQQKPQQEVEQALDTLNACFATLQPYTEAPILNRLQAELARMRMLITRVQLNRDTEFLQPAYALLELFLIGSVLALLLIHVDHFSESLTLSCLLFTSFSYLLLLIRDLDNPFQYDGHSSVDVDLSLLTQMGDRLQQTLTNH